MTSHENFMRAAISLSKQKMQENAGGPFGAVVVKDGVIIAEGWNQVTSKNDPTAHAEVVAIRKAAEKLNDFSLEGCVVYTSCQPCPMCLAASYWARLDKIYYANTAKDAAEIGFDDSFIYEQISLPIDSQNMDVEQLLRDEALEAFKLWQEKKDKKRY